jgi:predicted phosphodiesterase
MIAVISDIHANVEALAAVLDDIASRGITHIICLGDVIGYGPEPGECLDLVKEHAAVTLMGNHDYAVLYEPNNFNLGAEAACFWTRQQLEAEPDIEKRNSRWDFLGSLKVLHEISGRQWDMGTLAFVHGSMRRPINEYVFADDVYNNPNKLKVLFERIEHVCFVGHTHVPGVFTEGPDFYSPDELESVYEVVPGHKALINVGSVGQPRDRNPQASYAIIEPCQVRFVRVPYQVDTVMEKVLAIPDLDDYLGIRLKEGR